MPLRRILIPALTLACVAFAAHAQEVAFAPEPGRLAIHVDGQPFAVYVFEDPEIPRPYFKDVREPGGFQVTRNHPPVEGKDPTDHATYHPGIWMAFGDISGADFWRNKARVRHEKFTQEPQPGNPASFEVSNAYETSDGKLVCRETCRYTIAPSPGGVMLLLDSRFTGPVPFTFGDQEEMGLGLRVATAITVKQGSGALTNSDGLKNEDGVWGKPADWCDYGGIVEGRRVGMTLLNHPGNFRKPWFHARDYGLLVANPFGRNAFTEGEKSAVIVPAGEEFRLRYGVWIYGAPQDEAADPADAYRRYLDLAGR
jgi:hypothetical protein